MHTRPVLPVGGGKVVCNLFKKLLAVQNLQKIHIPPGILLSPHLESTTPFVLKYEKLLLKLILPRERVRATVLCIVGTGSPKLPLLFQRNILVMTLR